MVCNAPIFVEAGFEAHARDKPRIEAKVLLAENESFENDLDGKQLDIAEAMEELQKYKANKERSKRRAKAKFRDYALCGDWDTFVTLTLDGEKVDRFDIKATTKKVGKKLDNLVKRKDLSYVLVPELHKSGAIHFHGFWNSQALEDSGTMKDPNVKKPRKVSKKRQAERLSQGWKIVYNLPDWTLGFSTAIKLDGDRMKAINYCSKYITKGEDKIGGRWYYSGGILRKPQCEYFDMNIDDISAMEGAYRFTVEGVAEFVILWTEGAA